MCIGHSQLTERRDETRGQRQSSIAAQTKQCSLDRVDGPVFMFSVVCAGVYICSGPSQQTERREDRRDERREGKGGAQLQRPSRVTEIGLHTGPSSSFSLGRQAKLYTPGGVDDPVLKAFAFWPLAAFT